jgi:serine/threonine-protein kinase
VNRAGELIAGRFELYDQIGRGGAGSVWRAYDRKHGDFVAAKLLTHTDAAMVIRFVREQSLRVQHPNVVTPSGWAADDDHVVLRMDLLRGGSVATLIGDHGPLPEDYVAVLLDQVFDALGAVHAIGVVHRDVKPANLLLAVTGRERPVVRLSDFGIAAVVDEPRLTHAASSLGTLGYMAPEQAAGADPDPLQDLYAVGVLGRVLLTGSPPRQLPDRSDSRLWPWLQRLSSPRPADRPASADVARRELASLGIPTGMPWVDDEDSPEVFDQLGPDPVRTPGTVPDHGPVIPSAPPSVDMTTERRPRERLREGRSGAPIVRDQHGHGRGERPHSPPADPSFRPPAEPSFRPPAEPSLRPSEGHRRSLRVLAVAAFVGSAVFLIAAIVFLLR